MTDLQERYTAEEVRAGMDEHHAAEPAFVPVQGLLAELANQHTQTPKAVVKLHPQPVGLDSKPSVVISTVGSSSERAALRMGKRNDL